MNQYQSSSQLKGLAKNQLSGKYGTVISALLVPFSISFLINMFLMLLINDNVYQLEGYLLYCAILFIVQIFLGIFSPGIAKLYLNIACNRPYHVMDIFYGFKAQPNKIILVVFMQSLFGLLCSIPTLISLIVYFVTKSTIVIPFLTISIIFTIVSTCIVTLMFSQVIYLLVDLPRYSAWETLKISAQIMKGHKGRLFYLQISFIGMILLGLCTCDIGFLWIMPYMNATYANFYLDLMHVHNQNVTPAAEVIVTEEPVQTEDIIQTEDVVPTEEV